MAKRTELARSPSGVNWAVMYDVRKQAEKLHLVLMGWGNVVNQPKSIAIAVAKFEVIERHKMERKRVFGGGR